MKEEEKKNFTVYLIKFNGVIMYIGKTNNFKRRILEHRGKMGTPKSAIPKYVDLKLIEFVIAAEFIEKRDALKYEDSLICKYQTIEKGWNKLRSGLIYKENTKEYLREYDKIRDATPERKAYQREKQRRLKEKIRLNRLQEI